MRQLVTCETARVRDEDMLHTERIENVGPHEVGEGLTGKQSPRVPGVAFNGPVCVVWPLLRPAVLRDVGRDPGAGDVERGHVLAGVSVLCHRDGIRASDDFNAGEVGDQAPVALPDRYGVRSAVHVHIRLSVASTLVCSMSVEFSVPDWTTVELATPLYDGV